MVRGWKDAWLLLLVLALALVFVLVLVLALARILALFAAFETRNIELDVQEKLAGVLHLRCAGPLRRQGGVLALTSARLSRFDCGLYALVKRQLQA